MGHGCCSSRQWESCTIILVYDFPHLVGNIPCRQLVIQAVCLIHHPRLAGLVVVGEGYSWPPSWSHELVIGLLAYSYTARRITKREAHCFGVLPTPAIGWRSWMLRPAFSFGIANSNICRAQSDVMPGLMILTPITTPRCRVFGSGWLDFCCVPADHVQRNPLSTFTGMFVLLTGDRIEVGGQTADLSHGNSAS